MADLKAIIESGKTALGIEFGSTRIKAVLIDESFKPIASGSYRWENQLIDGFWTYSLDDIWKGLRDCYKSLVADVKEKYGAELTRIGSIGFSAMMHGYMAFDEKGELLVPFRTWRNSTTGQAAEALTELFNYNIPQRWSISHLYQAILNGEEHVDQISYLTTLAGYIHWQLTGRKVLGIGDASGMFPINDKTHQYDETMVEKFGKLIEDKHYPWTLTGILPKILVAGESAGVLTEEGAKLLDESGKLQAGIPLCPPEGDAGTGMAATNSIGVRTGNVSAGTSVFAMVVLEDQLKAVYPEIDMVTTPVGSPVAMVHANNCTSEINAWVGLFREFAELFGMDISQNDLFEKLFKVAMEGDADCGDMMSYGYYSGENITDITEGRPLFVRKPTSRFSLANFMRLHLSSALGALKVGMDILIKKEHVAIDKIYGHGGYFTTKGVGQKLLAAAIDTPVSVMETAGEGGPWGMALLASYLTWKGEDETLQNYLEGKVFAENAGTSEEPDAKDIEGFEKFIENYKGAIAVEKTASEVIK